MQFSPRSIVVFASLSYMTACGGDGSVSPTPPTPPVATATIHATPAIQFTPATVNLLVGGTVTFDFGAVEHNVYFDNAPAGAPWRTALGRPSSGSPRPANVRRAPCWR